MKPYLRDKKIKGSGKWKQDHHPKKGYMNWWEEMCNFVYRSNVKQKLKKEINNDEL